MMETMQQHPLPLTHPEEEENYQQPVAVAEITLRAGCTLEREQRASSLGFLVFDRVRETSLVMNYRQDS